MAGRRPAIAELHAGQLGPSVPVARRGVPDERYRGASVVELIEAGPDGATLHLGPGGAVDFDLVVCADGYRSMGRRLVDRDAALRYRGVVGWRGLLHESDLRADPLDGCDLLRVGYQGGARGLVLHSRIRAERRTGQTPSRVGL